MPRTSPTKPANAPLGGLAVYEKGKLIFQVDPVRKAPQTGAKPTATPSGADAEAQESERVAGPAIVAPGVADASLIARAEPQYPEQARAQHIQGTVLLDALISESGVVRDVKVISGDSLLAEAAVEAVRQWRYRPYQPDGQPVPFRTQITVRFALPAP
jgi:protein TonB